MADPSEGRQAAAARAREKDHPHENRAPIPRYVLAMVAALVAWGAFYIVTSESEQPLSFSVLDLSDAMALFPSEDSPNTIFLVLLGICAAMVGVAVCACVSNKIGCRDSVHCSVDEARWASLIAFALQFWDFASDVTLTFSIWRRADVFASKLIFACAVGTSAFVALPYAANLRMASRIKGIAGIRGNESARTWFETRAAIFTALVAVTGGAYPALSLVSSNLFGLSILNSGLTRYELRRLAKIKVLYSVLLENVPQCVFQALYAVAIAETEGIPDSVLFAMTASVLSVISSVLSFCIALDFSHRSHCRLSHRSSSRSTAS